MRHVAIVCGSRFEPVSSKDEVYRALDVYRDSYEIFRVLHGAAQGIDSLAARWAIDRGVEVVPFQAEWSKYGKGAGPMRNTTMASVVSASVQESRAAINPEEHISGLCIVFPGGVGTENMRKAALRHGLTVSYPRLNGVQHGDVKINLTGDFTK